MNRKELMAELTKDLSPPYKDTFIEIVNLYFAPVIEELDYPEAQEYLADHLHDLSKLLLRKSEEIERILDNA